MQCSAAEGAGQLVDGGGGGEAARRVRGDVVAGGWAALVSPKLLWLLSG